MKKLFRVILTIMLIFNSTFASTNLIFASSGDNSIHVHLYGTTSDVQSVHVTYDGTDLPSTNTGNSPLYITPDNGIFVSDKVTKIVVILNDGSSQVFEPASAYYQGKEANGTINYGITVVPKAVPSISITKSVDPTSAYPGQTVIYTMSVINTGNVVLTGVEVKDPMLTNLNGAVGVLAVNEKKIVTGTYVLPVTTVVGTTINNIATAAGNYGIINVSITANAVLSIVSVPLVPTPRLSITKSVDPTSAYSGQIVTYTMNVTNTGNVALTGVEVKDPMLTNLNGTVENLAVGEIKTVTGSYIVPPNAVAGTTIINTATVKGYFGDRLVNDTASAALNIVPVPAPGLSITKVANVTSANIGDTIQYTFTVTNTGNVDLQDVTVTDTMLGLVQNIDLLAQNTPVSFTKTYVVPEGTPTGNMPNTATAKYGDIISSSTANVEILEQIIDDNPPLGDAKLPSIQITKSVDKTTAKVGDKLNYTINVKNTGNVDLENVIVTDQMLEINETILFLKQGDTKVFTKSYIISQDTTLGNLTNTASAMTFYNDTKLSVTGNAVTKVEEDTVNIVDNSVPLGEAKLPQTGGMPFGDLVTLGSILAALGFITLRKK